ncbi:LysR family transcriptional regulator [Pseudoflavonifractor sp. 60]|uniref:LysR family transcriptional regulator n=1 Tax=Pseudoflavonifractor sp. 60 TaxID=2304576 RepID=UPI00136C77F4|nr:LysR family transcriptional regulator [Pseudoflavonifractor sp. 60]NBI69201.1 LysR family transcriptional regulator [Pseudoflavonifractor sp. 60]
MFNNYHYFIALADEGNISKAARRLFISHQCLSRYLKNLEQEYKVAFFDRTPKLTLTPAGQVYLDTIRQMQLLEENLDSQLDDIRQAKRGSIVFGTTDGRYRILVPDLLAQFKQLYPGVVLEAQSNSDSKKLSERVLEGELDMVLLNKSDISSKQLVLQPVLDEQMYLIISDNMLKTYFPNRYPQCISEFSHGANLAQFQHVPFVMGRKHLVSRRSLEDYCQARQIQLNCVMELGQLDLHSMMTARDYAASFCWSMFVPAVQQLNREGQFSHLHIFPMKGEGITNQLVLVTRKGKIFPAYGRALIRLIKENCGGFADPILKAD